MSTNDRDYAAHAEAQADYQRRLEQHGGKPPLPTITIHKRRVFRHKPSGGLEVLSRGEWMNAGWKTIDDVLRWIRRNTGSLRR